MKLELALLGGRYALAQIPHGNGKPAWVSGEFTAVVSSREGISVVCEESAIPAEIKAQTGFCCFEIVGEFDLASVGVLASVVRPLADAGISVFAYSTWETDYVFVQEAGIKTAISALIEAGHTLRQRQNQSTIQEN